MYTSKDIYPHTDWHKQTLTPLLLHSHMNTYICTINNR